MDLFPNIRLYDLNPYKLKQDKNKFTYFHVLRSMSFFKYSIKNNEILRCSHELHVLQGSRKECL